jgi:hypothetical protein
VLCSKALSGTKLALWFIVVAAVLLGGCAAQRPAQKANASLLLTVVIKGDPALLQEPPEALIVTLDDVSAGRTRQFAFEANSRIPGHRAEFPVRMDVPAGRHRLSGVSGVMADGAPIQGLEFMFTVEVEARAGATHYLGHLEASGAMSRGEPGSDAPGMVLVDAYEDDLPDFVHAWPELRRRKIGRHAPQEATMVALIRPSGHAANEDSRAAPLDASVASHLPERAQLAFEKFLNSQYPRAFAVGSSGAAGLAAGGTNVIERALRECRRAQGGRQQPCTLFALDDTLMQSLEGSSGAFGGPPEQ